MAEKTLIIGLTGTNASGKGVLAEILKKKGFEYHSLSDVIRDELQSKNEQITRKALIIEGNRLRKQSGPAVLAMLVKNRIKSPKVVIDSIRNTFEIDELKKLGNFILIALDAPINLRYERAIERGRLENASTPEEFRNMEQREKSGNILHQQIDQCMKLADHLIINDGTVEELEKKIDRILSEN